MLKKRVLLIFCSIGFTTFLAAQPAIRSIEKALKNHITFLADDKLEGRRAGTNGEKKAREYIIQQYKANGLLPKGEEGFLQPFEIQEGRKMTPKNSITINGKPLQAPADYFVMPFSANSTYTATSTIQAQDKNKPWFIDISGTLKDNANNPHFDTYQALYAITQDAIAKGASALIFYNSGNDEDISFNKRDKSEIVSVPVVYFTKNGVKQYLEEPNKVLKLALNTDIIEGSRTAYNVIGFIDNKAAHTVVLGAHYDHLGYGEDGGSMLRTGERLIHNGADDNASGTAALIELSRLLKKSTATNNNYLFIAFSAEELGLFGSKHFVDHPTIAIHNVNYMINMDMVGRLNDSTKALTIGGYGTSPLWASVIENGPTQDFTIKIDSSGAGPSDHTSFYRKDIPVLFYFTGLHHDYHKPSDDYDKINYKGAAQIVLHILKTVKALNAEPKLAFLKTRETQVSTTSFRVTLGIMPDYTFSGDGVKADGVTDGRPAALAGVKAGDILTALGDFVIKDMDSYMKALNKFKKGDTTTLKFKRGAEEVHAQVTFK